MDDNPAMTLPASQQIKPGHAENSRRKTKSARNNDGKNSNGRPTHTNINLTKYDQGWRRIVRNFTPSWFSVTMGTGVVASILATIPWRAQWLHYLSIVFFVLNVALFSLAFTVSFLRYTLYPEIWTVMIQDATNSLFLGTIPMGFATLIKSWIAICVPIWGHSAAYVAWALWIVDSIVAVSVTVSLGVLLMSESHQRSLDSITAAQLLPIAATIVAAGTGSGVAEILPNPQHALGTIIASYVMWGMATPMALSVLVMYYQRLALHKMPPREVIVSAFLPLGPLGFGGYTILNLGKAAATVFPKTGTLDPLAGRIAYVIGFFVALVMWGWGLLWLAFALAALFKTARHEGVPFNMGWWGFTFPLGVYSLSTILIGEELPSLFFRVLGTIFGVAVILLWVVIAIGTAKGAWTGELFHAPCLANLKVQQQQQVEDIAIKEKTATE